MPLPAPSLPALVVPLGSVPASSWILVGVALAALAAAGLALLRSRSRLAAETAALSRRLQEQAAELARLAGLLKDAEASLRQERGFLAQFLQAVPDAVYFKDTQSRFVRCSESVARILRQTCATDVIGKTDFDFFSREHAQPAFDDEKRVMETGQPMIGKLEKETFPDGRVSWSLTSKLPWRDEHGKIIGTFGIGREGTEILHTDQELRQRELLFRLVFEHAPIGIYWHRTDLGGDYHFNAAFCRMLGLPATQTADRSIIADLAHPEDLLRYQELRAAVDAGKSDRYSIEQRFVLKDGRLVWGRLSVAVVRNEAGHVIQEIAILEDITIAKRAEQELSDTYKHLMDAARVAGTVEMANGILHNVGNVLNSVNVSVNVLAEGAQNSRLSGLTKLCALLHEHAGDLAAFLTADAKGQRVLPYLDTLADHLTGERQRLIAEVASLRQNVDHIKDIVGMQQSYAKKIGQVEVLPPATLFEDALRLNAAALARHDIEVVREFQEAPEVQVERHKALQILVNLIRNAKYALDESQRANKQLLLRIEAGGRGARLVVRDNGVGIAPENLERIFTHGFTTKKDGHGFGLHASILAARDMGGALIAQSEGVGRGATFVLELPRARNPVKAPAAPARPPVPATVQA